MFTLLRWADLPKAGPLTECPFLAAWQLEISPSLKTSIVEDSGWCRHSGCEDVLPLEPLDLLHSFTNLLPRTGWHDFETSQLSFRLFLKSSIGSFRFYELGLAG